MQTQCANTMCSGCDVDRPDSKGRAPIHWACYMDHERTAEWLVRKGADIHRVDVEQCTPLHWAAIKGTYKTVRVLLRNGAANVLDEKDVTGMTPLQLAADKVMSFDLRSGSSSVWMASRDHPFCLVSLRR